MFGYEFVELDKAAKVARRQSLDESASIAQWSILPILALIQLAFLAQWVIARCAGETPRSPHPQPMTIGRNTWIVRTKATWTKFRWWADEPLRKGWFTSGETLLAGIWTLWLLFLCVNKTGNGMLVAYVASFHSLGILSVCQINSLTLSRLSPSHKTLRYCGCIATSSSLPPRHALGLLSDPAPHSTLLRACDRYS